MIWWTILTCAQKLTCSQLSLPHGNQTKKNNEETENIKRRCSEETVQSWSPWREVDAYGYWFKLLHKLTLQLRLHTEVFNNEFVLIWNFTTEAILHWMFILLMFHWFYHSGCIYTSLPCTNEQYKITRRRRNWHSFSTFFYSSSFSLKNKFDANAGADSQSSTLNNPISG